MRTPKVSVVMTVYNGEKYLRQSVDSILNQTYRDFEFIIVDSHSTDATPLILKEYSEKNDRIKIITERRRSTPAKSRNKGIKVARGKYIAVQDADDISLPMRLEKQVEYLEKNRDVILLGTSAYIIDEGGEVIATEEVLTGDDKIREVLPKKVPLYHGSIMFRRKEVGSIGFYHEQLKYSEDHDLYLRTIKIGKIDNLPEPLYMWRLSKNTISMRKILVQKGFPKLDPETFYRYRLCRTLVWGGNFERARKEINALVKERYLTLGCTFKLVGCYIATLLGPGSATLLKKVVNFLSSFGITL